MPPLVDSFPAGPYDFGPNNDMGLSPFSLENSDAQMPAADPIMWGGMSQLSLDQGAQKYYHMNHISQYGQITPPNDSTPNLDPVLANGELGNEDDMQEDVQPKRKHTSKRAKREAQVKRKSKEAEVDDDPKPRKATRKARKGYKATTKEEEDDSEGEVKREKFLERNRVAASKCRQKKKEWTSGLESHARDLATQNATLHAYALQLRNEVLLLKGECLRHTDCDCTRIREYLDRSISRMNPSGALHGMPQPFNVRKPSMESTYTLDTLNTATTASRTGSLESDQGGGMSAASEQEMQALLEASIASSNGASPESTGDE
ncbi:hypothetical protein NA57DRAFT_71003 [Rhizodiscina lignyota]|uniref:BZIP domain-containing protein n=1 Tax=Rhizodiscina lignyota TaxID=1504668 RepID=A0A9P4IRI9_9PEZI|nr:hypothetical protein NA57DRAFT_71003 [Rhizodiscina lignyota]